MVKNLAGLKVLVSRLQQHSAAIASAIENLGGQAVCQPLYTVESTIDKGLLKLIDKLAGSITIGIFISRNAVDMCMPYLHKDFAKIWATTGPGTAEQLNDYGINDVLHPAYSDANSVGLFNLMLEKRLDLKNCRIVIFTGADFDNVLQQKLASAHAKVETLVVYRRGAPKDLLIDASVNVILISCVTSLINLQNAAPDLDLPLVAASDRIATAALEMGYSKVYTSRSMQDTDLIDALSKVNDARQRKQD